MAINYSNIATHTKGGIMELDYIRDNTEIFKYVKCIISSIKTLTTNNTMKYFGYFSEVGA